MWLLPTFDKSGDIYNPKLGEFFVFLNKEMIISMYCSLNFYLDHLEVYLYIYPHQIARLGWFYLKTFYQYFEIHIFILLYIVP